MVFVARRGVFRERELICKEETDIEEILELTNEGILEDTSTQPAKEIPVELVDN